MNPKVWLMLRRWGRIADKLLHEYTFRESSSPNSDKFGILTFKRQTLKTSDSSSPLVYGDLMPSKSEPTLVMAC